jgi:hypothetical protein
MLWKPAKFVKTERRPRRPVAHNTINIPDHMVTVSEKDIPELTIKLGYASLEERTKGEVVELIQHMNNLGKFVSKVWVCNRLNFRERKADDIFAELKREGKIEDFLAVRNGRNHGSYWRIAGDKARRKMQLIHANMRRARRASLLESINSPEGSLEIREETQAISDSGTDLKKEFEPAEKISLRHQGVSRNHEDGSPGNGLEGTHYTEAGCFDRLSNPERNPAEYALIERLAEASEDKMLTPAAARSAARRIDSGVINKISVVKICKIIESKQLAYSLLDLIRNFDEILKEHCETIRPGELDYIKDQIDEMADGTSDSYVFKEIALASKTLRELGSNVEQLTYTDYYNFVKSYSIPVYAKLVALSLSKYYKPSIIKLLAAEFEKTLFAEITANLAVHDFLINFKKFNFIDWNAFAEYRRDAVDNLRCTLFVNKIRNRKLDIFASQLHFFDQLYNAHGSKHYTGVINEYYTERHPDTCGSVESSTWTCSNP